MACGDNADVTAIDMGAHTGTHMDAPATRRRRRLARRPGS